MCDTDYVVDQLLRDFDETSMPLPDVESAPHLLISNVRKHYMEYIIKLLTVNYENNQRLLNKNIYLPSAIWRCAKSIELNAAQTCMVVQLYRKNMVAVIKELKSDTKKGKLNRKLYECLHRPPLNEKKVQTLSYKLENCNCQCDCRTTKRRRKASISPHLSQINFQSGKPMNSENNYKLNELNNIPVIINSQVEYHPLGRNELTYDEQELETSNPLTTNIINQTSNKSPKASARISVESQDSDELMTQLEKLFQGDPNDDDIFDGTLCDTSEAATCDENIKKMHNDNIEETDIYNNIQKQDVIDNHAAQIKSLDERLANLAGLMVNNSESTSQQKLGPPRNRKCVSSKWVCEEYFLKARLFEMLDQIGDCNRKKLVRIKELLLDLFGPDSDDEGVVSPLEETPEFIISCKERIAPWVVKLLTPYYIKGRIRGKALFKSLAKHLIRLIYQCSRYPHEYEVHSFISDFLDNHKLIRCEADFKKFRIENI